MIVVEKMARADWPAVQDIFAQGIKSGNATFEKSPPSWEEWDRSHLQFCRFVAKENSQVFGWAALSAFSSRTVYAGVAEVSLYVADLAQNRGVGTILLETLVESAEKQGLWTLQAGIFPENEKSIHLHKKCGFKIVGTRNKLGQMHGVWRDVLLMERRSTVVGL